MNPELRTTYLNVISGRSSRPAAVLARNLLAIVSGGYALAATLRSAAFDIGIVKSTRVDRPVISIGNLTTGGTGKTPMVEAVARHLRRRGVRIAILSRGYGSEPDGGMNDEGLLLDQNLPDVPHLQGADRTELARTAIEELESEALILDDGHQHRYLARDLNIVMIDATNPFGYGWTLPRGLLREPLRVGLRRADVIVLTRCDMVSSAERAAIRVKLARLSDLRFIWCESVHRPKDILYADGHIEDTTTLAGKRVALFCGLGNPEAFRKTAESLGAIVVDERKFPDHHRYDQKDLTELSRWVAASGADLALTSQKDFVKLPVDRLGGRPLAAVRIEIEFLQGENELLAALEKVVPQP
jgi:tetraacyldisaccharide 4'-kinase